MIRHRVNPYLPPGNISLRSLVFNDRVYVYGSHDLQRPCLLSDDYVCWSAPVNDLGSWRYERLEDR